MKILFTLFITLFLINCSEYNGVLKKDSIYHNSLIYTKKEDIINSFETKAIISATYLNRVDSLYKNSQNHFFLVGIYISDDNKSDDKKGLYNSDYLLTLDSKEPINISEVEDIKLKSSMIPFYNKWATYYILEFENIGNSKAILKYSHKDYGSKLLDFTQTKSKLF